MGGSKEEEEEGEGGSEGWHAGRKPGSRGKSATVVWHRAGTGSTYVSDRGHGERKKRRRTRGEGSGQLQPTSARVFPPARRRSPRTEIHPKDHQQPWTTFPSLAHRAHVRAQSEREEYVPPSLQKGVVRDLLPLPRTRRQRHPLPSQASQADLTPHSLYTPPGLVRGICSHRNSQSSDLTNCPVGSTRGVGLTTPALLNPSQVPNHPPSSTDTQHGHRIPKIAGSEGGFWGLSTSSELSWSWLRGD